MLLLAWQRCVYVKCTEKDNINRLKRSEFYKNPFTANRLAKLNSPQVDRG